MATKEKLRGRPKKGTTNQDHESLYHMVQYYIAQYYQSIDRDRTIQESEEAKFTCIEAINERYLAELEISYPHWRDEESEQHFKNAMDYLINVYSKREAKQEMQDRAAALTNQVLENMERSKKIREHYK